jgi:hypothetical protein
MSSALTLTHCFGTFELPSHDRRNQTIQPALAPRPKDLLISDIIPSEEIRVSSIATYRLSIDEHEILRAALKDSVKVRTVLRRE